MHKLRTAAVILAAFGSVGLLGAGTAHADQDWGKKDGDEFNIQQSNHCRTHDLNVNVLGNLGLLNGLLGLNDEGNAGAQNNTVGSKLSCSNAVGK
ncbi:hypothetical protein AB0L59_02345 [Streptomyces sp. NPDC052109]|uniref:hypothetical protein n=1 Tax=Streptomyces sp. NPDC052109 TaxID=3155527 RepID=UPI00341C741D